jgi:hypothetical protein
MEDMDFSPKDDVDVDIGMGVHIGSSHFFSSVILVVSLTGVGK